MNKLILTADDYGAVNFIDAGIEIALREKKITSVACFVTFPDSEKRIKKLLELKSKLKQENGHEFGIGLHFSITAGFPVLPVKSMMTKKLKDGTLKFKQPKFYPYDSFKNSDLAAFRDELRAQIGRMQDILGNSISIDCVSNHHGYAYIVPSLYKVYVEVISEFDIPIRSPLTWSRSGLIYGGPKLPPIAKPGIHDGAWRLLVLMGRKRMVANLQQAIDAGLPTTYCVADVIYGQPDVIYLTNLIDEYEGCDMSTELMLHLGHAGNGSIPTDAPEGIDPRYFETRTAELSSLRELDLEECAAEHLIQVGAFRQLTGDDALRPGCLDADK